MNRKETTASLAIVCMALLATIMTATTPKLALAIDYGSPDLNYQSTGGFVEDGADSSGTSDNTDKDSMDEEQEDSTTAIEDEGSEDGDDSSNDQDSSSLGYEAFLDCLAEIEEFPTEEEVQDCVDSTYSGMDNSEDTPAKSTDRGDGENGERVSTDLTEEEEEEEDEVSEE
jgi:hypothetical protein